MILYFTQLVLCQKPYLVDGSIAVYAGDSFSYTGAMDNLIEHGSYRFWNGTSNVYAGRLPHYAAPYFLLRLVAGKTLAQDLFAVLQILTDAAATVVFGLLCFEIFGRKITFWIGYALYFLSFNFLVIAQYLSPESLSLSFFIFFLYFFHRYWAQERWTDCVTASVFLALVVVLKPYLVLIYVPFLLAFTARENFFENKRIFPFLKKSVILGLPLLLLLLPWIARNAVVLGRFVPAQESMTAGYNYTAADFAFRRFVGAWGGSIIFWDPEAVACYFDPKPPFGCAFKFPDYALANENTLPAIEDVRRDYIQLQKQYDPELERTVVEKFDRLTATYKAEKPFMYYVGSKFLSAKNMLWHTNNNNLPISAALDCYEPYQLLFKLIQFGIYLSAMTLGTIGLIWLAYRRRLSLLSPCVPLILIAFFSYFGWAEARYFNHAYPVMLVGLTCVVYQLLEAAKKFTPNSTERLSS